ncbi:MAG: hypothetical protein HYY62_08050 [Deltaproteobacteria bacterium]|nr:hypothetical protein [Deltaproteobacteria bacterium]
MKTQTKILFLTLTLMALSGATHADEVGNGGFYLPKNDKGELIQISLGLHHPDEEKLHEAIQKLRIPDELKDWIKTDLETSVIYYSNEVVKKENINDGPEKPAEWFPETVFVDNQTLLAAYTFSNSRIVVYFTPLLNQLSLEERILLVLHESIHRLQYSWFGKLSLNERFVMGFVELLKKDLTEGIPDDEMKKTYHETAIRFQLPSYEHLPNGHGDPRRNGKQIALVEINLKEKTDLTFNVDDLVDYDFNVTPESIWAFSFIFGKLIMNESKINRNVFPFYDFWYRWPHYDTPYNVDQLYQPLFSIAIPLSVAQKLAVQAFETAIESTASIDKKLAQKIKDLSKNLKVKRFSEEFYDKFYIVKILNPLSNEDVPLNDLLFSMIKEYFNSMFYNQRSRWEKIIGSQKWEEKALRRSQDYREQFKKTFCETLNSSAKLEVQKYINILNDGKRPLKLLVRVLYRTVEDSSPFGRPKYVRQIYALEGEMVEE